LPQAFDRFADALFTGSVIIGSIDEINTNSRLLRTTGIVSAFGQPLDRYPAKADPGDHQIGPP